MLSAETVSLQVKVKIKCGVFFQFKWIIIAVFVKTKKEIYYFSSLAKIH